MITEKQIEKAITSFFKVENNIDKWGRIKKHSNICWEYYKYDESLQLYKFLMMPYYSLIEQGKVNYKNLPFRNHIMDIGFKRLVICENKESGINLMKRYNTENFDIEKIKINKIEYYILY